MADGTNDSSTKHLTFQVFFFIISFRLRAIKTLYIHFCNFIKKMKGFFQRTLQDTWNIICLVNELFVPSAQQTNVLYCRLTDFSIRSDGRLFGWSTCNVCFKKTGTKCSSALLLHFVPVFLKQTLWPVFRDKHRMKIDSTKNFCFLKKFAPDIFFQFLNNHSQLLPNHSKMKIHNNFLKNSGIFSNPQTYKIGSYKVTL